MLKLNPTGEKLPFSQEVDDRGFFIGINTLKSDIKTLKFVADSLGKAFLKNKIIMKKIIQIEPWIGDKEANHIKKIVKKHF